MDGKEVEPRTEDLDATDRSGVVPHLLSIAKSIRQLATIEPAEIDVVVGQDQFRLCLGDGMPRSVIEIAEALAMRPSTVSEMADRPEERGRIARAPDLADARRVLVRLTDEGVAVTDEMRRIEATLDFDLAEGLSSEPRAGPVPAAIDALLLARLRRLR